MADFGAEVIKVELPGIGDQGRHTGTQKDGVPLTWQYMNRSKKSVTLNLRVPEGQDVFKRLVAHGNYSQTRMPRNTVLAPLSDHAETGDADFQIIHCFAILARRIAIVSLIAYLTQI